MDESQHLHIAWHISNGKTIFKDFFEHHGAIFGLLNGLIFKILNIQPQFEVYYLFRFLNFTQSLVLIVLTFLIGRLLFQSKLIGIMAAAFLSGNFYFHQRSFEIRPDTLQNVFWYSSQFLLLWNWQKKRNIWFLLSGVLMGMAILTNTKAVIGVTGLGLGIFLLFFWDLKNVKKLLLISLYFASGVLSAYCFLMVYFWFKGGIQEFHQYSILFNFSIVSSRSKETFNIYSEFVATRQYAFTLFSFAGMALVVFDLLKRQKTIEESRNILFLAMTIIPLCGVVLNLFNQYWMIFLPSLSILAAKALHDLYQCCMKSDYFKEMKKYPQIAVFIVLLSLTAYRLVSTPFIPDDLFLDQRIDTEYVLRNAKREDPITLFWSNCAGYVFNEDTQFHWVSHYDLIDSVIRNDGYNPFGDALLKNLKEKNVRFILEDHARFSTIVTANVKKYIEQHYVKMGCIWLRRQGIES